MDGKVDLNTKDDFLDALRKEYNKGHNVPDNYLRDVFEYSAREAKVVGK